MGLEAYGRHLDQWLNVRKVSAVLSPTDEAGGAFGHILTYFPDVTIRHEGIRASNVEVSWLDTISVTLQNFWLEGLWKPGFPGAQY